jgi:muramoyltetrapeptide carboxypeptidase LdcA involved in peptidoglycan recycling
MKENQEDHLNHKGGGLWKRLQEQKGNVVKYNGKPITLGEFTDFMTKLQNDQIERKKQLDKEYTDISKITLKEIDDEIAKWEKDGEKVPNGLMCKVKIAGSCQMWPIKGVQLLLEAAEKKVKEWKNETRKREEGE